MATTSEVVQVLRMLAGYYGTEPDDSQVRVYVKTLADIDGDVLEQAALDHIAVNNWFPKVAELRKAARKVKDFGGRSMQYPPEVSENARTWQRATALYGAALRGEIDARTLEADPAYRWLARKSQEHPAGCECKYCQGYTEAELAASLAALEQADLVEFGEVVSC